MLEDRVVPSIAPGTILVATSPAFASPNPSSYPTGIIAINPTTRTQTAVSTGGMFSMPTYLVESPDQQLYVSDLKAFGTGAIIRVDPNTGQQSLVATGGLINGPDALAYVNGFLYVADQGNGTRGTQNIVRVNPSTGQQTLVMSSSSSMTPTGMAPAGGDTVYITYMPANPQSLASGAVWQLNVDTGQQTLVSQAGLINHPADVAVDPSGMIVVANAGTSFNSQTGSVLEIDPQTGFQTLITSFAVFSGTNRVEVGADGTILVGAMANSFGPGQVLALNPGTGGQSGIASGGSLSLVGGMQVFTGSATASTTTTVISSANPSVIGRTVTFTATVAATGPGGGPTGTVQFQVDGNNVGSPVTLTTSGGVSTATFNTSPLLPGTHTVTANYSGDSRFAPSSGGLPGGQIVNFLAAGTTTTAVNSSANPSAPGQSVTFTATIIGTGVGGTPTGTVLFVIDGDNGQWRDPGQHEQRSHHGLLQSRVIGGRRTRRHRPIQRRQQFRRQHGRPVQRSGGRYGQ